MRGDRSWSEHFNTVDLAYSVLKEEDFDVQREKSWLEHPESGLIIFPQLVEFQPLDDGGIRTTTTLQVNHPLLVPEGTFEYQHSSGDKTEESIRKGFDQWMRTDFLPLLDASQAEPRLCTSMEFPFPPERVRRAVFGPVMHLREHPPAREMEENEEHPFCPCCMLTNSLETFKELFETDGFIGLRLFAARTPDGSVDADCRVNGIDWEKGVVALRNYASTWTPAGFEFRKQYVVIHTVNQNQINHGGTA